MAPTSSSLPPTFKSLYRLFLRATASSVLHHTIHTRHLRALFKPTFQEAARVIHFLEKGSPDREQLSKWLYIWQTRIDSTLSLLANSSASRGVSHSLTRNLGHIMRTASFNRIQRSGRWNPRQVSASKAYQPKPLASLEKQKETQAWNDEAYGALGEVVMMAEGRHGLLLGRVRQNGTISRYT